MTPIDKIEGLRAAQRVAEVEPAQGAEVVEAVEATDEVAQAQAADPLVALFDEVAEQLRAGEIESKEAALEAAVSEVLAQQLPFIDAPTRAVLSARISLQLWSHPELSRRVARLLG